MSFANNIFTPEGGTHMEGFRTALTRVVNDYARKQNILKEKDANLTGDDIREGLTAVISVKLGDPQFEGQTKAKLGSSFMRPLIDAGYIYSACPPIFGIKVGKKIHYVYPHGRQAEDEILRDAIQGLGFTYDEDEAEEKDASGKLKKKKRGYTVQRYKGRGEMDPKPLASTTMDPKTRILQRVTIDDAAMADKAVRELMGSQVEYRRDYIERHAHDARFLDA